MPRPSVFATSLTATVLMCVANLAFAVNTRIVSLTEAVGGTNHRLVSYDYHRDNYDNVWLKFQLSPIWVYDPTEGRYKYAVTPGESWTLKWIEVTQDRTLSEGSITYVGGESYCWSSGACGAFSAWGFGINARCFDETEHRVELYHNGEFVDSRTFKPTRFSPKIVGLSHLPAITPALPYGGAANLPAKAPGKTDFLVKITDNWGCQKPLKDVQLQVKNTVIPGSGGHSHFTDPDEPGTGTYAALTADDSFPNSADKTQIHGKTDERGEWKSEYTAGEFGLIEKIDISAIRPAENGDAERRDNTWSAVTINIDTVLTVPFTGSDSLIFVDGGTCDHDPVPGDGYRESSARYMSIPLASRLVILDGIYSYATGGRHLSLNDASLPYGGAFDNGTRGGRCHQSHRRGVDIDINHVDAQSVDIRSAMANPNGKAISLKDWLIRYGKSLDLHQVSEPGSFHLRLIPGLRPRTAP